jgi:hypothetical protein
MKKDLKIMVLPSIRAYDVTHHKHHNNLYSHMTRTSHAETPFLNCFLTFRLFPLALGWHLTTCINAYLTIL